MFFRRCGKSLLPRPLQSACGLCLAREHDKTSSGLCAFQPEHTHTCLRPRSKSSKSVPRRALYTPEGCRARPQGCLRSKPPKPRRPRPPSQKFANPATAEQVLVRGVLNTGRCTGLGARRRGRIQARLRSQITRASRAHCRVRSPPRPFHCVHPLCRGSAGYAQVSKIFGNADHGECQLRPFLVRTSSVLPGTF